VFTFVVYGMSGLRNTPAAIIQNGVISTLLSLIAVQVRREAEGLVVLTHGRIL
jgi:hypothetical protein